MSTPLNTTVAQVTERIRQRSAHSRRDYLDMIDQAHKAGTQRKGMGCANLAHAFAASPANDKLVIRESKRPNIGIVTAYNDMLSAHQPYATYPEFIKQVARDAGGVAQVAGGVPAMCDGST